MSTPSNLMDPDSEALGTSSCSRLRVLKKVDLPQPEGPIRAVTFPASILSDTRSSTLRLPNQQLTFSAVRVDGLGVGWGWDTTAATWGSSMVVTNPPPNSASAAFPCDRRDPPLRERLRRLPRVQDS